MTDEDVLVVKRLVEETGFDHIEPEPRDQGGLGPPALPLLHPQPRLLLMGAPEDRRHPRQRQLPARGHGPDPRDGRHRPVPHPRAGGPAQGAHLRRPRLPDRVRLALPAGGLPRALRDRDDARRAPRCAAARARYPHHHRRHELRRALGPGQGGPRAGRHRRRHLDHHRRRRHDPRGAQGVLPPRLPGAPVALRVRPGRPAPGRRRRDRGRAREPSRAAADCCSGRRSTSGWPPCARCRPASTSARPAATPTGSGPTICASRSRSCARPPSGRSRST